MMAEFHFIRPYWLLSFLPLIALILFLLTKKPGLRAWSEVCDPDLLEHLIHRKQGNKRFLSLCTLCFSGVFLIIALAGPTWTRYPVPSFKKVQPRVLVLDLSTSMLTNDIQPNRISRAKFKLHDLFGLKDAGLFGLVVYTNEPFIVSPLTEDAQTIDSLLSTLSPEIMPVQGQNLEVALAQAAKLITQGGYSSGDVLVLTGSAPTSSALDEAKTLANEGIHTSIMPILKDGSATPMFDQLAKAGHGQVIALQNTATDLKTWLDNTQNSQKYTAKLMNDVPVWRDEGRWFLIPALLLLMPVFRRGWLQRLAA